MIIRTIIDTLKPVHSQQGEDKARRVIPIETPGSEPAEVFVPIQTPQQKSPWFEQLLDPDKHVPEIDFTTPVEFEVRESAKKNYKLYIIG